jgi:hypothetical protein
MEQDKEICSGQVIKTGKRQKTTQVDKGEFLKQTSCG